MIFSPKHKVYKEKAFDYLSYLTSNQKRFELREIRKPRSQSQKGYMYVAFNCVVLNTGSSLEEVKQILFKEICNPDIFIRESVFDNKKYLRSTEDLDTKEMFTATENFRNHCALELGIYIPGPDECEKLEALEAEISMFYSE